MAAESGVSNNNNNNNNLGGNVGSKVDPPMQIYQQYSGYQVKVTSETEAEREKFREQSKDIFRKYKLDREQPTVYIGGGPHLVYRVDTVDHDNFYVQALRMDPGNYTHTYTHIHTYTHTHTHTPHSVFFLLFFFFYESSVMYKAQVSHKYS